MPQTIGPLLCKAARGNDAAITEQRSAQLRERNAQQTHPLTDSALTALRCRRCGSEWIVRDADLEQQRRCPCCGAELCERMRVQQFDTLGAALYGAVEQHGQALLGNPDLLAEAMLALAPALKREIRIFSRTLAGEYVEQVSAAMRGDDAQIASLHDALIRDEGLSLDWASSFCEALRTAAELRQSVGKKALTNVDRKPFAHPALQQKRMQTPDVASPQPDRSQSRKMSRKEAPGASSLIRVDGMSINNGVLVGYSGTNTAVEVPNGVREIGTRAFSMRTDLVSVSLPASVERIDNKAFYGCVSLVRVTLPEGLKSIGDSAFFNCSALRDVTIPDTVHSIGSSAFVWCSSLERAAIPGGVEELRVMTFANCTSLRSVVLCEGVKAIGSGVFSNCKNLSEVSIPRTLERIGANVFERCGNLKELTIPKTTDLHPNVFVDISPRIRYYQKGSASRAPVGGAPARALTYSDARAAHASFRNETATFTVPSGYTHITRRGLLPYAALMRTLILPKSVRHIDPDAFTDCRALQRIVVEDGNPYYRIQIGKLVETGSSAVIWTR